MSNAQKTSGWAIAAFISVFLCMPVGLVLGIVALVKIKDSQGQLQGKGLAIAAIALSGLAVPMMGMLAAIAIPNFVRYQTRAKGAEGRMVLMQLVSAQEMAMLKWERYVPGRSQHPNPGQTAPFSVEACDAKCEAGSAEACTSLACLDFHPTGPVRFQYACEVSPDAQRFTCAAYADLDSDGEPGILVYGSGEGPLGAPVPKFGNDNPACNSAPSGQIFNCTPREF